jgi:hypothetical protein
MQSRELPEVGFLAGGKGLNQLEEIRAWRFHEGWASDGLVLLEIRLQPWFGPIGMQIRYLNNSSELS